MAADMEMSDPSPVSQCKLTAGAVLVPLLLLLAAPTKFMLGFSEMYEEELGPLAEFVMTPLVPLWLELAAPLLEPDAKKLVASRPDALPPLKDITDKMDCMGVMGGLGPPLPLDVDVMG